MLKLLIINLIMIIGCVQSEGLESTLKLVYSDAKFVPVNLVESLSVLSSVQLLIKCLQSCNQNILCRTFDYDPSAFTCELYQGDMSTGTLLSSSPSIIGSVYFSSHLYTVYGASCDRCLTNRYLICVNGACQCPLTTFWDGVICQNQLYFGAICVSTSSCRQALNLTCYNSLCVCTNSTLYWNGTGCHRVLQWNRTGIVVAGVTNVSGITPNLLNKPCYAFVASDDNLYIADTSNARVQKWLPNATSGLTLAGNGTSGSASNQLYFPTCVYVDRNFNLYISDLVNYRIQYWQINASFGATVAGTSVSGNTSNTFGSVYGFWVDISRNIYVVDLSNHRVMKWPFNGTSGMLVAGGNGGGNSNNQLYSPYGIYVDELNSVMYIANWNGYTVMKWVLGALSGTFIVGTPGTFGLTPSELYTPQHIQFDKNGNMYVLDTNNQRVQMFQRNSSVGITIAGQTGTLSDDDNKLRVFKSTTEDVSHWCITINVSPPHRGEVSLIEQDAAKSFTHHEKQFIKTRKEKIFDLTRLKPGDHISFYRSDLHYSHHGIVKEASENHLIIIHYFNTVENAWGSLIKGSLYIAKVIESEWPFDSDKEELYLHHYDDIQCFSNEETLTRALSNLGETGYSLFSNNCEHWARWCRSGENYSEQVIQFRQRIQQKSAALLIVDPIAFIVKDVATVGADTFGIFLGRVAGGLVLTAVEGVSTAVDINRKHNDYNKGSLSVLAFKKYVVRRITSAAGTVIGGSAGMIVGTILIPVPILGSTIGGVTGSIGGKIIGGIAGIGVSKVVEVYEKLKRQKIMNMTTIPQLMANLSLESQLVQGLLTTTSTNDNRKLLEENNDISTYASAAELINNSNPTSKSLYPSVAEFLDSNEYMETFSDKECIMATNLSADILSTSNDTDSYDYFVLTPLPDNNDDQQFIKAVDLLVLRWPSNKWDFSEETVLEIKELTD
ncbi:unnamed protein product [Didymodactylos carnosus]|uniref:Uncharacterized protein n=1 Tax=Didymodactylos carnosus TaxID=1234261 RepID=A0A814UVD5_9BILA|nr:unnamed protein product [Didymodactylos carnosus]CAF3943209.1 unnamed protein product [Didymodactylos carnosus]